jgi:SecD/SecF fusion protein
MSREKIEDFIKDHYGPSETAIRNTIKQEEDLTGHSRDLTIEEVQRVKDLVAKVGALEFRILANSVDDKQGIKDAQDFINSASKNPLVQEELDKAAVNGLPPPGPRKPGSKDELQPYDITLPHSYKSRVTYSWVEIGKQERKALGFSNAAQTDPNQRTRQIWNKMEEKHDQAVQITDPSRERYQLWQGALFYRRDCKDRNLPEKERRNKRYEYFVLSRNPEIDPTTGEVSPAITGTYLSRAAVDTHTGRPTVSFNFDSKGANLFGTLTRKNVPSDTGGSSEEKIKRHLSIILDGLVMSAPTINSEISYAGQITGDFTRREVDSLVNILRSGALPATLKPEPVSETTMGATIGTDTRIMGTYAVIFAFIGVVVFMLLYYRFAGLVACVALFANLLLTVGFMVSVQATFTLAGLAGLVLMLGMAVDANVLIYERLREERDRGASLALALRNGYERALPTIIDTHLTSIFTAIVLYAVGNDQLKGFGISLAVGLIISLFTSLFMTRVMFDYWLAQGWLHKLSMMRLLSHPNVNFMGIRTAVFTGTVLFSLFGLGLFLARVPYDLDIDFKGGTALTAQLQKAETIDELRQLLGETRQDERLKEFNSQGQLVWPKVERIEGADTGDRQFKITYKALPGQSDRDVQYTVILANAPPGNEKADQEANVQRRVSQLPDWSVEQLYTSAESTGASGKKSSETGDEKSYATRLFTVRTSEMERELVQTVLDRLLQEKQEGQWKTLLLKNTMQPLDLKGISEKKPSIVLSFANPAYPSYVKMLFHRELRREFPIDASTGRLEVRYELVGLGAAVEGGKYTKMQVTFDPFTPEQTTKDAVGKVRRALENTQTAFNQRPQPERLENFDSELAADTRLRAVGAIFASWLAVILYLWFRFGNWTFGLAAVLCLIHDLCFTLGLVAVAYYIQAYLPVVASALGLVDFKIDLNGVAALLTLVGYSVADTIVVFDRIREVRGKNPELTPQIINDSINQTLSRTILTSFTTFIVVLILYIWGGPGVHLFAYIMTIGVIVGTLSSIFVASPLLLILGEGRHRETVRERRSHATANV